MGGLQKCKTDLGSAVMSELLNICKFHRNRKCLGVFGLNDILYIPCFYLLVNITTLRTLVY